MRARNDGCSCVLQDPHVISLRSADSMASKAGHSEQTSCIRSTKSSRTAHELVRADWSHSPRSVFCGPYPPKYLYFEVEPNSY